MKTTVKKLKALADWNRLRIVMALTRHDELCACQITELLAITGATASRHLSILQTAGWINSRKEGRWHYFQLNNPADTAGLIQWLKESLESSDEMAVDEALLTAILSIEREDLCRHQRGEPCCPTNK